MQDAAADEICQCALPLSGNGEVLSCILDVLKRYNIEDKWTKFLEVTQWKPNQ